MKKKVCLKKEKSTKKSILPSSIRGGGAEYTDDMTKKNKATGIIFIFISHMYLKNKF